MTTLLDTIEKKTASATAEALAMYQKILHREYAGQSKASDALELPKALDVLGLSLADFKDDLKALADVAALQEKLVDPAELNRLADEAAEKERVYQGRLQLLRYDLPPQVAEFRRVADVARAMLKGKLERTEKARADIAARKATRPRVFP